MFPRASAKGGIAAALSGDFIRAIKHPYFWDNLFESDPGGCIFNPVRHFQTLAKIFSTPSFISSNFVLKRRPNFRVQTAAGKWSSKFNLHFFGVMVIALSLRSICRSP